ncbi:hypothetical protein SAMN05720354_10261 [Nitrosospira sp. Nsp1]|nr:hypothetical protein SAMN05720354_10261 [Nitrosospira sp. Nsp1]
MSWAVMPSGNAYGIDDDSRQQFSMPRKNDVVTGCCLRKQVGMILSAQCHVHLFDTLP